MFWKIFWKSSSKLVRTPMDPHRAARFTIVFPLRRYETFEGSVQSRRSKVMAVSVQIQGARVQATVVSTLGSGLERHIL
ncbi:hypothetical protein MHYP_G00093000 [Metynnis hypsauchen]